MLVVKEIKVPWMTAHGGRIKKEKQESKRGREQKENIEDKYVQRAGGKEE